MERAQRYHTHFLLFILAYICFFFFFDIIFRSKRALYEFVPTMIVSMYSKMEMNERNRKIRYKLEYVQTRL